MIIKRRAVKLRGSAFCCCVHTNIENGTQCETNAVCGRVICVGITRTYAYINQEIIFKETKGNFAGKFSRV